MSDVSTHLLNHLLDLFLLTVHLRDASNLSQVDILAVSKRNNLVKGAQQLKCTSINLTRIGRAADRRDYSRDQLQSVDIYSGACN